MDLTSKASSTTKYNFLSDSKVGVEIQSFNWSASTVGPIESWPQCLRSSLGLLLHSNVPMFLFWGHDAICFYNDGSENAMASEKLKLSVGKLAKEIWWDNEEFLSVLTTAKNGAKQTAKTLKQIAIPNKNPNNSYFNTSLVFNENDEIGGIMLTFSHSGNDDKLVPEKAFTDPRFNLFVQQTNVGTIKFRGPEMMVDLTNEASPTIIGHQTDELFNKHFFDIFPEAAALLKPLLTEVMETGEPRSCYEIKFTRTRRQAIHTTFYGLQNHRQSLQP